MAMGDAVFFAAGGGFGGDGAVGPGNDPRPQRAGQYYRLTAEFRAQLQVPQDLYRALGKQFGEAIDSIREVDRSVKVRTAALGKNVAMQISAQSQAAVDLAVVALQRVTSHTIFQPAAASYLLSKLGTARINEIKQRVTFISVDFFLRLIRVYGSVDKQAEGVAALKKAQQEVNAQVSEWTVWMKRLHRKAVLGALKKLLAANNLIHFKIWGLRVRSSVNSQASWMYGQQATISYLDRMPQPIPHPVIPPTIALATPLASTLPLVTYFNSNNPDASLISSYH